MADESKRIEALEAELAEAKAKLEAVTAPKPQVIAKFEGVEITTASSELEQAMARKMLDDGFRMKAKELAPSVDEDIAVAALKGGVGEDKIAAMETRFKDARAALEKGVVGERHAPEINGDARKRMLDALYGADGSPEKAMELAKEVG